MTLAQTNNPRNQEFPNRLTYLLRGRPVSGNGITYWIYCKFCVESHLQKSTYPLGVLNSGIAHPNTIRRIPIAAKKDMPTILWKKNYWDIKSRGIYG